MKIKRALSLFLALALCLCLPAAAEQEDLAARVAELEALLAERDARVAELEARIAELEWALSQLQANAPAFGEAESEAAAVEYDGGVVTVAEARAEYEYRAQYYQAFGLQVGEYEDTLKQEVLESLAEDAILRAKAEEYGIYPLTEEDLSQVRQEAEAAYAETVAYYLDSSVEGLPQEELRQKTEADLAASGYTLESVLATTAEQAWRDRLYDRVTRDVELTEESLEMFYQREALSAQLSYTADPLEYEYACMDGSVVLWNPEGYRRIKALLVGFGSAAQTAVDQLRLNIDGAEDQEEKDRLQGELDQLYQGLAATAREVLDRARSGEDFMALIDRYSVDPLTTQEPTRSAGYAVSADSQVYGDAFRDAAMALSRVGDISDPLETDQGFYILKYEADIAPGPVPYEQVRDRLAENALASLRDDAFNRIVEGWIAESHVVYHPERL